MKFFIFYFNFKTDHLKVPTSDLCNRRMNNRYAKNKLKKIKMQMQAELLLEY